MVFVDYGQAHLTLMLTILTLLHMKYEHKILALEFVPLVSVNGSIVHTLCNRQKN